MSRPAIITDAEHAAHFVAEAMLEVMQATDGQRAAAELAEYLTEAFRGVQDLEGVADSHYEPVTLAAKIGEGTDETALLDDEPPPPANPRRSIGNEDGGEGAARHSPMFSDLRRDDVARLGEGGEGVEGLGVR